VSGHLGSRHRTDQTQDWVAGDPEGQRTRLHKPSPWTPLVFKPMDLPKKAGVKD
jgi:hypothetical protein